MIGMPLLIVAAALFAASFVIERVLMYLSSRRKRDAAETHEPLVMGGGAMSSQATGYISEPTIHRPTPTPTADAHD